MRLKNQLDVKKPWGKFEQFTLNDETTIKILTVAPGEALSLQYHKNRDEFNRAIKGSATFLLDDEEREVKEGDEYWVKRGQKHRHIAGPDGFQWLEISFGDFDEEDIVRIEDKYNRM